MREIRMECQMRSLSRFEQRTVAILNNNMRCERNLQYSSRIENYFHLNGWAISDSFLTDLIVVSGCGFHETQYAKVRSVLDHLKRQGFPESRVVIMGCLPKTHETQLKETFGGQTVQLHQEQDLDALIEASVPFADTPEINMFRAHPMCETQDVEDYFFIRIADGCTSKCTFCVIQKAKGYTASVAPEEIERQYRIALELNKRKICLISEDALAYGVDRGTTIVELLDRLIMVDADVEIHLTSIHAMWFSKYGEALLSLCRSGIIREMRIGLQHVNPGMLRRMGRKGDFASYFSIIRRMREDCPDLYLEADVIVGFPGESNTAFSELLEFFRHDKCFNRVQHFSYSDVGGSKAALLVDKVDPAIKIARWQELNRVLGERSSYNGKRHYSRMGDVLFKLSQENDALFCKDTVHPLRRNSRSVSAGFAVAIAGWPGSDDEGFDFNGGYASGLVAIRPSMASLPQWTLGE